MWTVTSVYRGHLLHFKLHCRCAVTCGLLVICGFACQSEPARAPLPLQKYDSLVLLMSSYILVYQRFQNSSRSILEEYTVTNYGNILFRGIAVELLCGYPPTSSNRYQWHGRRFRSRNYWRSVGPNPNLSARSECIFMIGRSLTSYALALELLWFMVTMLLPSIPRSTRW